MTYKNMVSWFRKEWLNLIALSANIGIACLFIAIVVWTYWTKKMFLYEFNPYVTTFEVAMTFFIIGWNVSEFWRRIAKA